MWAHTARRAEAFLEDRGGEHPSAASAYHRASLRRRGCSTPPSVASLPAGGSPENTPSTPLQHGGYPIFRRRGGKQALFRLRTENIERFGAGIVERLCYNIPICKMPAYSQQASGLPRLFSPALLQRSSLKSP